MRWVLKWAGLLDSLLGYLWVVQWVCCWARWVTGTADLRAEVTGLQISLNIEQGMLGMNN